MQSPKYCWNGNLIQNWSRSQILERVDPHTRSWRTTALLVRTHQKERVQGMESENDHGRSSNAHSPGVSTRLRSPSSALHPATQDPPLSFIKLSRTLVHLTPLGCPLRATKHRTLYYLKVRCPSCVFSPRSGLEMRLVGSDG